MKIGELVKILSGFAFDSSLFNEVGNGMPIIRIRDVGKNSVSTYYSGQFSNEYIIKRGDFLIGMDGDFRLSKWYCEDALLNQRVCKIQVISSDLFPQYLYYFLPKELKKIEDTTSFATVKHLSVKKIQEIQIPLPPLEQQKKIAAILDAADAYRQKTKALIAKYDELTQSLFLDMFGDTMTNAKNWPIKLLEELCDEIIDCPHSTPKYVEYKTEFPCIRTTELEKGTINWSKMKYLDYEGYIERTKRLVPKEGDVIYGREGTFGEAAIVPSGYKMSLGQRVMLFRPNTALMSSKFLHAVIRSNGVYQQALRVTSGSTVGHINVKDIKKFKLIVAPLHLQNQFAERVQAIEQQKAQAQAGLEKAEELFNSLLQRAFKGELV